MLYVNMNIIMLIAVSVFISNAGDFM